MFKTYKEISQNWKSYARDMFFYEHNGKLGIITGEFGQIAASKIGANDNKYFVQWREWPLNKNNERLTINAKTLIDVKPDPELKQGQFSFWK